MEQDRLTAVYGKPLMRGLGGTLEKALQRVKASLLRRLRDKLTQSPLSDRAKKALNKSLTVVVHESSLVVYTNHPAFNFLMKGQEKGQMTWLVKARAPIPIITETGELIFRTATVKSMRDGRWIHPGRPSYDFVKKAKDEARAQIRKAIADEMQRIAKKASSESKRSRKK